MKNCKQCKIGFEIDPEDKAFREQLSFSFGEVKPIISEPTLCPDCRMQRRLAFRNERNLYRRKCDLTGKEIISIYSPDKPYKVYNPEAWWGGQWDPLDYGKEFDFNRSFFEQYNELFSKVPLVALWLINGINSEYNNCCFELKDSYMSMCTDRCERAYYCYGTNYSTDITDCTFVRNAELCYECIDCDRVYNCFFSQNLENSSDCYFSSNLVGCKKCFGCDGLRNQELFIFNKKVTQEEWDQKMKEFRFTPESIEENKRRAQKVSLSVPKRFALLVNCEDCTGDKMVNSKNIRSSFDVSQSEALKFVTYAAFDVKHVQDAYGIGAIEWAYEIVGGGLGVSNAAFVNNPANGPSFSYYCNQCVNNSKNLFGCASLNKKEYCILNKQYSKSDYEALVPKIIEHMQETGEWGEFFPASLSPFGYNESLAQEYYPLKKEEVLARSWKWTDYKMPTPTVEKIIPAEKLPHKISDIPDDILNWAIQCEVSGELFKITAQELKFYRRMNLPIPHRHPDQRHKDRIAIRNPRHLWDRKCNQCQADIKTSYSPDRPETVYCEQCYLKEVY